MVWAVMRSVAEPEMVREAGAVRVFQEAPFRVMVQAFTLVAFQETVVALPEGTRDGEALMETVGCRTVTVVMAELAEPPGPVQVTW